MGGLVEGTPQPEPEPEPEPDLILGNRGGSGIDGVTSTALGVAWATGRPVTLLIGDLAFLHDVNGLMPREALERQGARLRVVVVNNDGGGIFDHLPASGYDPPFTEFIVTPHGRDLSKVAVFHGLPHAVIRSDDEPLPARPLEAERMAEGITLTEIQTRRGVRPAGQTRLEAALAEALPLALSSREPAGDTEG
jgi:2-succinyl-5-enolpyruvyl-6-hydroxy-3-cyclohexene-1-carboxylate synthase